MNTGQTFLFLHDNMDQGFFISISNANISKIQGTDGSMLFYAQYVELQREDKSYYMEYAMCASPKSSQFTNNPYVGYCMRNMILSLNVFIRDIHVYEPIIRNDVYWINDKPKINEGELIISQSMPKVFIHSLNPAYEKITYVPIIVEDQDLLKRIFDNITTDRDFDIIPFHIRWLKVNYHNTVVYESVSTYTPNCGEFYVYKFVEINSKCHANILLNNFNKLSKDDKLMMIDCYENAISRISNLNLNKNYITRLTVVRLFLENYRDSINGTRDFICPNPGWKQNICDLLDALDRGAFLNYNNIVYRLLMYNAITFTSGDEACLRVYRDYIYDGVKKKYRIYCDSLLHVYCGGVMINSPSILTPNYIKATFKSRWIKSLKG